MKIAIASTGLGNVTRGIETWALDTANALQRRGVDVTLFAAGAVVSEAPLHRTRCLPRTAALNHLIVRSMPGFTWRWGLKSDYALEQLTFWHVLKHTLNQERFELLHVQDPVLADCCRRARQAGRVHTREILAHGTEEPLAFLARFTYLQHLAPWHLEQALATRRQEDPAFDPSHWTAIPNFVDTDVFQPVAGPAARAALRRAIGLPENAFILGTAAAIKTHHKRIDWLIHEFAAMPAPPSGGPRHLVIAGSRTPEFEALEQLANDTCGPGRVTFLPDYPHARMPDLLRALDAFTLASLFEMMPIALIEAIASGLPVLTHRTPVLDWMAGPGGIQVDMHQAGSLAKGLQQLEPEATALGIAARQHALDHFSENVVIRNYIRYYNNILQDHELVTSS